MYFPEGFHRLGITITTDVTEIKKAYQMKIAMHHPEVDPEGFMQIHQAYKAAMAYAQGRNGTSSNSAVSTWRSSRSRVVWETTEFDSLFAELDREESVDLTAHKKEFSRMVRRLKWHWLPIPLKCWQQFFNSETYLLCRNEQDCMDELFGLAVRKIHTYPVFRYLLNRLWDLEAWQKGEGKEGLANNTQKCLAKLNEQYSHYLKRNMKSKLVQMIFLPWWYYQALPFLFKLLVVTILFPVIFIHVEAMLVPLLLVFYGLEISVSNIKASHELGPHHPDLQRDGYVHRDRFLKNGSDRFVAYIYGIMIHLAICIYICQSINGNW